MDLENILLPDELVSFITVDSYRHFSLTISMNSYAPFDNYIALYFANYNTQILEPVNVTFSTIGGRNNTANASGITNLQFYYRSDDNSTDGEPQITYFNAYVDVHALHKLTVYSSVSFRDG